MFMIFWRLFTLSFCKVNNNSYKGSEKQEVNTYNHATNNFLNNKEQKKKIKSIRSFIFSN